MQLTKGSMGFQPVLVGILPTRSAPIPHHRSVNYIPRLRQRQDAVASRLEARAPFSQLHGYG
jgi:hypothetical protein